MNILITTMGRAAKGEHGYKETAYLFEDGIEYKGSYFGSLLKDKLSRTDAARPDKHLIIGTAGSMWDVLLEEAEDLDSRHEDFYYLLSENVANQQVTSEQLDKLGDIITPAGGAKTVCRLLSEARTPVEQSDSLKMLAVEIPEKSNIWFDVTHGYRHMPILQLISAFYLVNTLDCHLQTIYYGAYAMQDNGVTPVVEMPFVSDMIAWIQAVSICNHSGDYSALAGLVGNRNLGNTLKQVSFYEHVNQIETAAKKAGQAVGLLKTAELSPAAELYRDHIGRLLDWRKGSSAARRQWLQAQQALKANDIFRCAILLREALVTAKIPPGEDVDNMENRARAEKTLRENTDGTIETIMMLRNALAHATLPRKGAKSIRNRVMKMLSSREEMMKELKKLVAEAGSEITK